MGRPVTSLMLPLVPFLLVFDVLGPCGTVVMDPSIVKKEGKHIILDSVHGYSENIPAHAYAEGAYPEDNHLGSHMGFTETFESCLRDNTGLGILIPCFNKGALAGLIDVSDRDAVDITDGVSLERDPDDKGPRTMIPTTLDPTDFRGLLDVASMIMKRRSLRYDMAMIHPGLVMRVGPTLDGTGVLEFVMDHHYPSYIDRTVGTGRLIARSVLLPLLLGFKLPLVTVVPLIFAVLVFVAKKAFVISKIAMIVSGVLGLNSYFYNVKRPHHHPGGPGYDGVPLPHHEPVAAYSAGADTFLNNFNHHIFRGVNAPREAAEASRNFSWEKKTA